MARLTTQPAGNRAGGQHDHETENTKPMTIEEMTAEIAAAKDSSRIATLHWRLNHMGLSREEYLTLERLMTGRLYDGSMTPLPVAPGFAAYA